MEVFRSSSDYWERRYQSGGNSGAGSYNRLAEFKAEFLNRFVKQNQVTSVVELGCGDGAQLSLAQYPEYTGADISPKAVEICRNRFGGDASKRFLLMNDLAPGFTADLSLSLDVVFHLVEDQVFDAYMRKLFDSARRFAIVYSSNTDWDSPSKHERHRQFTKWVAENRPAWHTLSIFKNAYPFDPADPEQTSIADFYVFAPR
jgi:SAM-dependent methyltransferase